MIVLVLEKCPMRLRGYVSRWLSEIATGVYVGNVSANVRQRLWDKVTATVSDGRCIMIYSYANEQGWAVQSHNALSQFIDFDGLVLPMKPSLEFIQAHAYAEHGTFRQACMPETSISSSKPNFKMPPRYCVIDIETTGLNVKRDAIIEIAALAVEEGVIIDEFNMLISTNRKISKTITRLTGIINAMLARQGKNCQEAISAFQEFIADAVLVGYNIDFDKKFIDRAVFRNTGDILDNISIDVLPLARKYLPNLASYKLADVCTYMEIEFDHNSIHRADTDVRLCNAVFQQLSGSTKALSVP